MAHYPELIQRAFLKTQRMLGLHYRPVIQIECDSVRLGSVYGGWAICPDNIDQHSIVYSFGVGEDISFDMAMIAQYDCRVFAFDPTPRSIQWIQNQSLPEKFHFFDVGIANYDGYANFFPPTNNRYVSFTVVENTFPTNEVVEAPVKKLETIASDLEHSHINILKLDIEGAEYDVLPDLLTSGIKIDQILVEFHHRFSSVSVQQTQTAIDQLNEHGYKLFYVSKSGEEYSFINEGIV